jgi:hypothetical protein
MWKEKKKKRVNSHFLGAGLGMESPLLPLDYLLHELPRHLDSLERLVLGLTCSGLYGHLIARPRAGYDEIMFTLLYQTLIKWRFNGAFLVLQNGSTELRDRFHWDAGALTACEYWIQAPSLEVYLWYAKRDVTRWWPTGIRRMVPHVLIRDPAGVEELKHYLGHHLWAKAPRHGIARITKVALYDEIRDVAEQYNNRKILRFLGFLYSLERLMEYNF